MDFPLKVAIALIALLFTPAATIAQPDVLMARELARFAAPEATQAVAVDADHFYAIANSVIAKYDKQTGERVAQWDGRGSAIAHLNAGVIIDGRLYASNSNFPDVPMASSIEIFDVDTMRHTGTISLGIQIGSLVYVLPRPEGGWFAGFAHYDEKGGTPGRGADWTQIVRFDAQWRRTGGWALPSSVIESVRPTSTSGAVRTPDGLFIATHHHNKEAYVLRPPKAGPALEHVATITTPFGGQGIALDPADPGILYAISRPDRAVVRVALPDLSPYAPD